MYTRQQNQQREQQEGQQQVFVSFNPNLADILEGESGTHEVITGNQAFSVTCKPGHSIVSLIPIGPRPVWVLIPEPTAVNAGYLEESQRRGQQTR